MKMSDLPNHVRAVADRHGKTRYRFRRAGYRSGYINAAPGTPEFMRQYAALLEGKIADADISAPKAEITGSIDHLARLMMQSPAWMRQASNTRHTYGRIIERFCDTVSTSGKRYGDRPVASVTTLWLDKILGGMADRPQAANMLRKTLKRMLTYAVKIQWRVDNPAALTDAFPAGKGYHTWSEAEIALYRKHHALGTTPRLAFELALNTAARRCNVALIEREHIKAGRIAVAHVKGGDPTNVPMTAEAKAAIDAMPAAPIRHLILTSFGKPFTVAGFGNAFRDWCDQAGLPKECSLHGIRKARSRQLAESGATTMQGRAVTGHTKDATFEYYAEKANRERLADDAMAKLREGGQL